MAASAPPGIFDFGSTKRGWSQEQNQEQKCLEQNPKDNYRQSQEQKCGHGRLDFAEAEDGVRRALGFDGDENGCPLPGHHGGIAWLELAWARPGHEFTCDCLGRAAEWGDENVWRSDYARPLADAYAAVRTGWVIERETKPLSKGERLVWSLLLAHEVGLLEPVSVLMPSLSPGAPELGHQARAFFGLLAGLRLAWMAPGDALPMPFADRLVGAYLGVDRKPARAAINALRQRNVIEVVGRMGERGPYLFEPRSPA